MIIKIVGVFFWVRKKVIFQGIKNTNTYLEYVGIRFRWKYLNNFYLKHLFEYFTRLQMSIKFLVIKRKKNVLIFMPTENIPKNGALNPKLAK